LNQNETIDTTFNLLAAYYSPKEPKQKQQQPVDEAKEIEEAKLKIADLKLEK